MSTTTLTPSARTDWEKDFLRESERRAIDTAAEGKKKVTEIADEQRRELDTLFRAPGGAGAVLEATDGIKKQLLKGVEEQADKREENIDADMRVDNLPEGVGGVQYDHDRSTYLAADFASVEADPEQVKEISDHEARHALQAKANIDGNVALTGDPEADKLLSLPHIAYREADAMKAAGWKHTSKDYVRDYLEPVQEVADYLNAGGESGDALVLDAGLNGKMFELHDAIRRVAIRRMLNNKKREAVGAR